MADLDYTVITRKEAREAGRKRYFTGQPCTHGHVAERLEVNGSCCECTRLKRLTAYHANIEEERRKQKIRRDSDPNLAAKKWARRARRDPEYVDRSMSWRAANEARRQAESRGESQYFTGRPCIRGHLAKRFTNGGKCVECSRLSCLRRHKVRRLKNPAVVRFRRSMAEIKASAAAMAAERAERARPWRQAHEARQAAIHGGALTYQGKPCPHGHAGVRYTRGGGCVECHAIISSSAAKKAYDARYGAANKSRIRERQRRYHERTSERRLETARAWASRNKEKVRATKMAYKARRRQQELGGDPTALICAWERATKKVCHWCGVKCPKLYHVDHYVPLAKGGKHEVRNLVIACRKCNLKKSARDPYEFAATMGRLF